MPSLSAKYDVVIIGGGHMDSSPPAPGQSRLIRSCSRKEPFEEIDGMEARLSLYSYLVSLFPEQIVSTSDSNSKPEPHLAPYWVKILLLNHDPDHNRKHSST